MIKNNKVSNATCSAKVKYDKWSDPLISGFVAIEKGDFISL